MKFLYVDGEKLVLFENKKKTEYESLYIKRYRESMLRSAKNKEWKKRSDVEISDEYYFGDSQNRVDAVIHSVSFTDEENKLLYSFGVNETSGLYFKYTDDKEKTEAHGVSSFEVEFKCVQMTANGHILGSVAQGMTAKIAVFSPDGSDYKCITDGDTLDENPSMDKDGNILFNSYAVARDSDGNFITYMPSELYKLDLQTMQVQTLLSDRKYSYIKPIADKKGNIYCIRKPAKEKEGNAFLDFLMIPVRIVQAIVGFVSAFVLCFAKKPMVSGSSAKAIGEGELSRENRSKKVLINNHLLDVEKELKSNAKYCDLGFIPRSWTLVRLEADEQGSFQNCREYDIAFGVGDFTLESETDEETTLVYTDGKHIHSICDKGDKGKREILTNVDFCVCVAAPVCYEKTDNLFDLL